MYRYRLKKLVNLFIASILVIVTTCYANDKTDYITVDRYTTVASKPTPSQINPLLALVQVNFPQNVDTVGDAVNYLLRYSGYTLVDSSKMAPELASTLGKPLPLVDRKLGPLKLQDVLLVLVGEHVFQLVQDPVHRQISFKVNDNIADVMNNHSKVVSEGGNGE